MFVFFLIGAPIILAIPLGLVLSYFKSYRKQIMFQLNVNQVEYKEQIKHGALARYALSLIAAPVPCFIGSGLFLYLCFYLHDGHISSDLREVTIIGSFWPFVVSAIIMNRILKMRKAYQMENKSMPTWNYFVWPTIVAGIQFGFWALLFYTPMQIVFMEIN